MGYIPRWTRMKRMIYSSESRTVGDAAKRVLITTRNDLLHDTVVAIILLQVSLSSYRGRDHTTMCPYVIVLLTIILLLLLLSFSANKTKWREPIGIGITRPCVFVRPFRLHTHEINTLYYISQIRGDSKLHGYSNLLVLDSNFLSFVLGYRNKGRFWIFFFFNFQRTKLRKSIFRVGQSFFHFRY